MVSASGTKATQHTGVPPCKGQSLVSTVVPSSVTGEDVTHKITNMDLAMKLHYVKGVYYFAASSTVSSLGIGAIKAPMFPLLAQHYHAAGRLRRSDQGRPFLKCNDSGVRIIEAFSDSDLISFLYQVKEVSREKGLMPEQVIGPHLQFSPLIYLQFTRFKCGGLAIGFSWSHILGDASSASAFMNTWSRILAQNQVPKHLQGSTFTPEITATKKSTTITNKPLSIKQVQPIKDYWIAPTEHKMESYTFNISDDNLRRIKLNSYSGDFELISALIWRCLAKIRHDNEPKLITICKCIPADGHFGNDQIISTVKIECSHLVTVELSELARHIAEEAQVENKGIEEQIDGESGAPDVIVYGANLTFVNMEEIGGYRMELKGQKPILASYSISGVGDEGAVIVQRGADDDRVVNVILPEIEIQSLRHELASIWGIA